VSAGRAAASRSGAWRRAALAAGALALVAAWLGPLPALARHAFAAHMAMHLLVVAVAAPLLALGVAGGRADPVRRWPAAFPALPATVLEFVVVWAWHAPALHQAARQSWPMQALEQGSFLLAGLLVWLSAFGGRGDERAAAGVAALLMTSMHMTLLGVLLAGAARPLYAHHGSQPLALALQDQQLGGVLMLATGGVAYLAGALVLLAGLLRQRGTRPADA
jgi:putative membrane protein